MTGTNPYRLPEDGHYRTVNFSGGRSSAYMLYHLLDAHDGRLPDSVAVVFANTGKELPETLDFVHECEVRWDVPVVWVEYRYRADARGGRADPRHVHEVVTYETASRAGEPFAQMAGAASRLPNVVERRCTAELKILTVERYCRRELGWPKKQRRVLGIRHDEPRRWRKALYEGCDTEYPMVHAGVTHPMVRAFWADHPFDLGIESWEGNCDLCFMAGQRNLLARMRKRPELADWWIRTEEAKVRQKLSPPPDKRPRNPAVPRFSSRWSYRELFDRALSEPDLFNEPGPEDESVIDCFCGD